MRWSMISIIMCVSLCSGCAALKEKTGEYVTEAIADDVEKRVENLLEKRGLSRQEIETAIDENDDGQITHPEVINTLKDVTKDYVLLEAKNYLEEQKAKNEAQLVSAEGFQSKMSQFWNYILGLVIAYLAKQIYSSRQDSKRDQRIAVLEKFLNRDLDGDGYIGARGEASEESEEVITG